MCIRDSPSSNRQTPYHIGWNNININKTNEGPEVVLRYNEMTLYPWNTFAVVGSKTSVVKQRPGRKEESKGISRHISLSKVRNQLGYIGRPKPNIDKMWNPDGASQPNDNVENSHHHICCGKVTTSVVYLAHVVYVLPLMAQTCQTIVLLSAIKLALTFKPALHIFAVNGTFESCDYLQLA